MKDITAVFQKAINISRKYNSEILSKQLEERYNIWCRLEDDTQRNWFMISETNGQSVTKCLGYLSKRYPVALLYEYCSKDIKQYLKYKEVLLEEYRDRYSCDEAVLNQYVDNIVMIDDRFLYDDTFPFNEEVFMIIDDGISYINPFNFTFESIK